VVESEIRYRIMNENLSEVLKRWRATGSELIAKHPRGSEGEVTGRTRLACADEVENAQKNHPHTAASLATLLAGSLVASEVGLEYQVPQRESSPVVYSSSLAAPRREMPAIPTEHIPGQEPEDRAPTTSQSLSASGSPNVSAVSSTMQLPNWTKVRAFTETLEPLRPLGKPPDNAGKK
jgi:hypothetical protein